MVDINSIAPDAVDKAKEDESPVLDHLYRILIYGNPGTAKTHFAYSMPEPVCIIDTEGKADAISNKFDKQILYFDADGYEEAREALNQSMDFLQQWEEEHDQKGTIVVDSITEMWDWAQQRHIEMKHPNASGPDDVNLKSALQSDSGGDWQHIKRLHNERFRDAMLMADYHICWTAKSQEDYAAIMSGEADDPPAKPSGEKNNIYKATELIHTFEGQDGTPHANLKKTALTKWKFANLEWPTFPKAKEIVETVAQAEADPEDYSLAEIMDQFEPNVSLYDGDPDVIMSGGEE